MKKITLFTLLTLLLCTSCVTKKKFMQAEMAATISKDSLQGLLTCLLYTSDAADDLLCVDLGGPRIIHKKKT